MDDGIDERWPFWLGADGKATQASPAYVILTMCELIGEMNGVLADLEWTLESELDALMAFPSERDAVVAYAAGAPSMEAQHSRFYAIARLDLLQSCSSDTIGRIIDYMRLLGLVCERSVPKEAPRYQVLQLTERGQELYQGAIYEEQLGAIPWVALGLWD